MMSAHIDSRFVSAREPIECSMWKWFTKRLRGKVSVTGIDTEKP
jgi:hypothetical protein